MPRSYKVLLDGMIESFAVTHHRIMIPKVVQWGPHTVRAEIPVAELKPPRGERHGWLDMQIGCLPKVASLARSGVLELYTSFELMLEGFGRPNAVADMPDFYLFKDIQIKNVPPAYQRSFILEFERARFGKSKEDFLKGIGDERFKALDAATHGNKTADVFHVMTAEKALLHCFLTADKKFVNSLRNQNKILPTVDVLTPCELAERFSLRGRIKRLFRLSK